MIASFQAHSAAIYRIKQLPNGFVATCSSDNNVKIWNTTANWTLFRTYTGHASNVYDIECINADTIASGGSDRIIRLWNVSTGQTTSTINANAAVRSLKLLSNGVHLAAGLSSFDIKIYDIITGGLLGVLSGHVNYISDMALIGDSLLASSSYSNDTTIRIWNLTTYTNKFTFTNHSGYVYSLKMVSDDLLASGSCDKTLRFWNITNGTLVKTWKNHTNCIFRSLDLFSSQLLVSGSVDKSLKLWNLNTGEVIATINTDLQILSMAILSK